MNRTKAQLVKVESKGDDALISNSSWAVSQSKP